MKGVVHSFESFATLDGGGIRFAIFLQGCPLRCVYCHNVDTQAFNGGKEYTPKQIVAMIDKLKHYYAGGGVTISGGEPLAQADFLLELIKEIKTLGLHVAVDTSLAVIPTNFDEIVALVDLFIIDLKFWDRQSYKQYCGANVWDNVLNGLNIIEQANGKVLLRTVVVPQINDTNEHMSKYFDVVNGYKCIQSYELLPYHTLGAYKYQQLGMANPLDGVADMDKTKLIALQQYLDNLKKRV